MKRIKVIALLICMILTLNFSVIFAEEKPAITNEEIALDLFNNDIAAPEEPVPEEPAVVSDVSVNPVQALVQRCALEGGSMELDEDSRFFIVGNEEPSDSLRETVKLMDAQFATYGLPRSSALPIVFETAEHSRAGDIVIQLVDEDSFDPDIETADINETYTMEISDRVVITACNVDGIYYGLITLLELSRVAGAPMGAVRLDCCRIADGPDAEERTLLLDCGRKYFSKDWIENLIRRASLQRYNAIELHFSDSSGLRFDSAVFPWLTEANKSLTREEMAEIIQVAKSYHMEVIPSVDVPGHNAYILERYADFVYANPDWSFECDGKIYDKNTKGFNTIANHYSYNGEKRESTAIGIDITKEHSRAFINALLDDYADFFAAHGCRKFNICGDEVIGWINVNLGGRHFYFDNRWEALEHWSKYAKKTLGVEDGSANDAFINYLNEVSTRLEGHGFRCRVFNDDINLENQHLRLNENVDVIFWTPSSANLTSLNEEGHRMFNNYSSWCYYVVKEEDGDDIMTYHYSGVSSERIYNKWRPWLVRTKSGYYNELQKYGGGYFSIWCDQPSYKNSKTIWKETINRTWTNSAKLWNTEISTDDSGAGKGLSFEAYKEFAAMMEGFPGFTGDPEAPAQLASASKLTRGSNWWQRLKLMIFR